MGNKRVKFYDSSEHFKKVDELMKKRSLAKKLKEAKVSFIGYDTLEEIEEYLNGKTGFVNTKLSATALGLEEQYDTIVKYSHSINLDNYKDDFSDLTDSFKRELKEKYTKYFSDEETKEIEGIEKVVSAINKLSYNARKSLYMDRYFNYDINLNGWNTLNQLKGR